MSDEAGGAADGRTDGGELVIETRALSKRFGKKLALDALDLALPAGPIHAIVGANGAGKSTLFRILLGFLPASAGEARVLGRDSRELRPADRARVGLVNEEHTLPPWMQVGALVAMQRRQYPQWDEAQYREVRGHFHLEDDQKVSQLSRGERAGLSLSLALGQAPELLILDEPTLGLDVVAKRAVLEALLAAAEHRRSTLLYCSHQMEEIERLADHLVVLERGRLVCSGAPDELRQRVRLWMADIPFRGPAAAEVPGLLQLQKIDGVHHFLVLDQGEGFAEVLRGHGARTVRSMEVSLDRAVNGLLLGRHAQPARPASADEELPHAASEEGSSASLPEGVARLPSGRSGATSARGVTAVSGANGANSMTGVSDAPSANSASGVSVTRNAPSTTSATNSASKATSASGPSSSSGDSGSSGGAHA